MTPKIHIGIPTRQYTPGLVFSALLPELLLTRGIVGLTVPVGMPVDHARNTIAEQALAKYRCGQATHLMWWDDDMIPPLADYSNPATGVAARLLAHGKRFVSGLYFKGDDARPLVRTKKPNRWQYRVPDDGLIEVGAVGFGCVMMEISILDEMEKKFHHQKFFQMPVDEKGAQISEDFYFCNVMEDMGIEMFVDCSLVLGHLKFRQIGRDTYKTQWDEATLASMEAQADDPTAQVTLIGSRGIMEDVDGLARQNEANGKVVEGDFGGWGTEVQKIVPGDTELSSARENSKQRVLDIEPEKIISEGADRAVKKPNNGF